MIHNENVDSAKSVTELVVKICLIITTALGTVVIILRLIRGDNLIHAVSAIVPASIVAVFYWMILSQRRLDRKDKNNVT